MQSVKICGTIHRNRTREPMTLTVTGMKIRMQEKAIHSKLRSEFGRKVPA